MAVIIFHLLSLYAAYISCFDIEKPNIVIIEGDDIGWDDISLHGSDHIQTPNIDMIGYQGVILQNYYTDCYGTPSRSAFFTGKYPMHLGTQGPSIGIEDRSVPLKERILPSYLKDLGYDTHLVGKWQLGCSRKCYLPMNRGFDTFYGFTHPVDYYDYNHMETFNETEYFGLGLFNNLDPVHDQNGHLTDVLTDRALQIIRDHDTSSPLYLHLAHAAAHTGGGIVNLQAPEADVRANMHIAHSARRLYAALVTRLDKSIGQIVAELSKYNMLSNTMIIFMCDNGASSIGISRNYGSNLPLRGTKGTPWEGAVRSTAVLWHAAINPKVWEKIFHVTDWLPTLLAAASGNETRYMIKPDFDGINQWDSIAFDEQPKERNGTVIAIDDLSGWGAFRDGHFKMIVGNVPNTCGYYGQELDKLRYKPPDYEQALLRSITSVVFMENLEMGLDIAYAMEKRDACNLNKRKAQWSETSIEPRDYCVPTKEKGCLYNITADPEESQDLWNEFPDIVQHMNLHFRLLWPNIIPRSPPTFDLRANPAFYNYIWNPWVDDDEEPPALVIHKSKYPIDLSIEELQLYAEMNMDVMKQKFEFTLKHLVNRFVESVSSIFV